MKIGHGLAQEDGYTVSTIILLLVFTDIVVHKFSVGVTAGASHKFKENGDAYLWIYYYTPCGINLLI